MQAKNLWLVTGTEILASLAALRAKVMGTRELKPRVALAESGNPGLGCSTPPVSSGGRGIWNLPSPFGRILVFLADVVEAEGDLIGFFTGGIGGELDQAGGNKGGEFGRGEPAPFFRLFPLFNEFRKHGKMFSAIVGRVLL